MSAPTAGTVPPGRLLVRGVNWLGDAVMTTPALLRLREHLPRTEISILTAAKLADLYAQHPAIDRVSAFQPGESVLAIARRIRAGGFDASLVLPNSHRSALEVFLGGVPLRYGPARPFGRSLLTHAIRPRPEHVRFRKLSSGEVKSFVDGRRPPRQKPIGESHQTNDYLHLVSSAFGCDASALSPRLCVSHVETADVARRFGIPEGVKVIGLNPGAEYGPAKRWPAERFAEATRIVQRREQALCLIFGTANDEQVCAGIESQLNSARPDAARSLAGKTSLRELMCLLKRCTVLLTNDSGPMHAAAALDVPVVVPFGSTSPELTGPLCSDSTHRALLRVDVPCSPCFLRKCPIDLRCLNGISAEAVASAVSEIMVS